METLEHLNKVCASVRVPGYLQRFSGSQKKEFATEAQIKGPGFRKVTSIRG